MPVRYSLLIVAEASAAAVRVQRLPAGAKRRTGAAVVLQQVCLAAAGAETTTRCC